MGPRRGAGAVAATIAAAAVLGLLLTLVADPAGEGANGAGLTYRDEFYSLSGAEVRHDRLGEVLAQDVLFQDTTTELRAITGIDVDTAVAALVSIPVGDPQAGQVWRLLSPAPESAADPWSVPDLAAAVKPHP